MKKGFTLIELLVVIGIIGILSAIVMASIGNARTKARIARAQLELKEIRTAFIMLENDTNQWPGHKTINEIESGGTNEIEDLTLPLAGLTQNDTSPAYPGWRGPYITFDGLDPWGTPYFFDTDYDIDPDEDDVTYSAVIGSYGPNKVGLNRYDPDDIYIKLVNN
jgi:prepilin-type N-terminal cleavage/methylation domain-containing protein